MKSVLKVKSKNTQVTQEKIEPKYVEDKATEQYLDYINESGNVMRHNGDKYVNTGINLKGPRGAVGPRGLPGKDGITPHIGENGNWYIGEQDTGSKAELNTDEYVTKEELDETMGEASEILDSLEGYSGIGEKLNELEANLETKANKDGFYETLGAGTALNLQGNTSKDATFTYRTAGGSEDIASGLATIHNIKGNTVVWNQLINRTGEIVHSGSAVGVSINCYTSFPRGHRIMLSCEIKVSEDTVFKTTMLPYLTLSYRDQTYGNSISKYMGTKVPKDNNFHFFRGLTDSVNDINNSVYVYSGIKSGTVTWRNINCIDLTLMFGAGNEPSTVEEFEQWLTDNVGLQDYYEYSEPTMLSADANSLETVGFNQWDGSYSKTNYYLDVDGNEVSNNVWNISDFIPVFGNTDYFINKTLGDTNPSVCFYDKDKHFISGVAYGGATSKLFTTPTNAAYLKFSTAPGIANQTNLNLSWSGIRNGEYEEYWKHTYPLNVKQLTSNGTVIFPNGMNRVRNVYDEIVSVDGVTKAIKRIGSVDLGTLSYTYQESYGRFYGSKINPIPQASAEALISNGYKNIKGGAGNTTLGYGDKIYSIALAGSNRTFIVVDSSYTDAATFKAAMNGVMLYYELATPIEYEIDNFEMPLAYKVDDFGTEETKKDTFALSPTFAVTYGVNAVDTLRRLPTNYISKESMQNFLSALGVQMNGTWTMTLDNNEYKFSFVANSNTNDEGV